MGFARDINHTVIFYHFAKQFKWIEQPFPKSAQALFLEFLLPLIIAYSP